MQKTRIVQFQSRSISDILKESGVFLTATAFYIAGIAIGSALVGSNKSVLAKAVGLFEKFCTARDNKPFISVFLSSIMSWLPYMLALFVCGTCIVGMAILPLIVSYKGFCFGILSGYLYSVYSFKGIVYVLILIIPCTIVGAFGLFFSAKQSFGLSLTLARASLPQPRSHGIYGRLTGFCRGYIYLLLVFVTAALLDSLLSSALYKIVSLS